MKKQSKTYNVKPLKTKQEIDEFIVDLRRLSANSDRDVLLFLIGINSGLRVSDIVRLKVKDVLTDHKIVEKKTGKPRTLYLSSLMDQISDYCKNLKPNDWLFESRLSGHRHISEQTVYKLLIKVGKFEGRDDIGTHSMRKTFGYWYYRRTHDIATLMTIFNHSSQAITLRYIGVSDDEVAESLKDFSLGV